MYCELCAIKHDHFPVLVSTATAQLKAKWFEHLFEKVKDIKQKITQNHNRLKFLIYELEKLNGKLPSEMQVQSGEGGCLISTDFKEFFDFSQEINKLQDHYEILAVQFKIRELIKFENLRSEYLFKLTSLEYLNDLKDYDVLL